MPISILYCSSLGKNRRITHANEVHEKPGIVADKSQGVFFVAAIDDQTILTEWFGKPRRNPHSTLPGCCVGELHHANDWKDKRADIGVLQDAAKVFHREYHSEPDEPVR
jgi:hypothetical protein